MSSALVAPLTEISSDMVLVSSYAPLALIISSVALSYARLPHAWPVHSIEKGSYGFFALLKAQGRRAEGDSGMNRVRSSTLSAQAVLIVPIPLSG